MVRSCRCRVYGQRSWAKNWARAELAVVATLGGDGKRVAHRLAWAGRPGSLASASSQSSPGGETAARRRSTSAGSRGVGQLHLDDFLVPFDPQGQGQGEGDLGSLIEPLALRQRQFGATGHPLQAAHQIVMADQAKVAAFGEPEADLGGGIVAVGPGPGEGARS